MDLSLKFKIAGPKRGVKTETEPVETAASDWSEAGEHGPP